MSLVTLTELTRTYLNLANAMRDHLGLGLVVASIVVTHDVQLTRASEVVLVLDQGHLVELGPPEQVLDAPRHEATRRLLAQASE